MAASAPISTPSVTPGLAPGLAPSSAPPPASGGTVAPAALNATPSTGVTLSSSGVAGLPQSPSSPAVDQTAVPPSNANSALVISSSSIGALSSIFSTSTKPSSEIPVSQSTIAKSRTSTSTSSGQVRASTTPTSAPDHRLAGGTVVGIAVAVGLGLALITFIATFLVMRRRLSSRRGNSQRGSKEKAGIELTSANRHSSLSDPKAVIVTKAPRSSDTLDSYLPQSADDRTVQNRVKTLLDQVELHVEIFYRDDPGLTSVRPHTDMAIFNSPNLPSSLTALLSKSRHATFLIKHALAQFITSSISLRSRSGSRLLPEEFTLVPTAIKSIRDGETTKPGFQQCMSRWRVLTAYLRQDPAQDLVYIAQRDHRIEEYVEMFTRAFAPWKDLKHEDTARIRSLSAILKSAADLGIFLFSQPSDLQFCWPQKSEVGASQIVVTPSLIKTTNERGQALVEPQVMLKAVIEKN